jgi:hypothetical protein
LRAAVRERKHILIAGGTSTGKTTLVNALLAEVAASGDRIVLIEDTGELHCTAPNFVALRTKDGAASLSDLVRSAPRLRRDRVPIGQVRGAEALDLLKAWGPAIPAASAPCTPDRGWARYAGSSGSSRKLSSPPRALIPLASDMNFLDYLGRPPLVGFPENRHIFLA